jgi:hypothetical protein
MDDFDSDIEDNKLDNQIIYIDSDIVESDNYDEGDFFGKDNEEYNKTSAFPSIPCPSASQNEYMSLNFRNIRKIRPRDEKSYFQFKFYNEKVLTYENQEYNRSDLDVGLSADQMINSYFITYCT